MSRIGKQPIPIPDGVTVSVEGQVVTIKGPRDEASYTVHPFIAVEAAEQAIQCQISKDSKQSAALWGTTRANLANIITGVTDGFSKQLEIQGVGYKAQLKGKDLELNLGHSHPHTVAAPDGITFSVEKEIITIEGSDKILVGQVAADIRKLRKPEPYKGKGIRYVGEHVRRKVGKVVGATAE